MSRRLVLIGGSAGSGKTTLARSLAGELGAGWLQVDSVWLALKAAADPASAAFRLLDVAERMADGDESDEDVLAAQVAAARAVCAVLPDVLAFELDSHRVLVADGAWLLPSFVAGLELPETEVHCVFLAHSDPEGVAVALAPRLDGRPPEQRHLRMNRRIWQYGLWLADQARNHRLPVVESRPFSSLMPRARAVLGC